MNAEVLHDVVVAGARSRRREDIFRTAACAARGFHEAGLTEGASVALLLRNGFTVLEASRAANLLGAYAIPIGWQATLDELRHILNDARPKILVADFDLFEPLAERLSDIDLCILLVCASEEESVRAHALISSNTYEQIDLWTQWLNRLTPWKGEFRASRGAIIYTSGTTGKPKGVKRLPQSVEAARRYLEFYREIFNIRAGIRAYIGGPLYHSTASAFARAALEMGDLLVLQTKFDAAALLKLVDEQAITHMVAVPTMFVRLLNLPLEVRETFRGSSLQRIYHTGASCPPEVKRRMIEWFGPKLYEIYGSTEVGAAVLGTSEDWLRHPGTVGRATSGTTIRILDDERRECPVGVTGEIFMRCEYYADFTYHNRDEQRAQIEHEGLLTSGDMGYLDAEGYLYLCDRKRDMIISGGVNVYPAEVETQLGEMPGVADCAVFGMPDSEFGERVVAVVQCQPGILLEAEDVRSWLRVRLSPYKVPKRVFFDQSLPRLETGKIKKRDLAKRYGSQSMTE